MRQTGKSDVYELFASRADAYGGGGSAGPVVVAGVPSLAASRLLRTAFSGAGPADVVQLRFEYHARFGKWVPVL